VYVGGGTPGLLQGEQLVRILETVRASFPVSADCEVAVEFDPASVSYDKLVQIKEAGYNRVSIGVQSFDEKILKDNNRPHVLADVFTAWDAVQKVGFENTNLDLIYPLIGLDMSTWRSSLQQTIDLRPVSITAYPLEVWPDTAYYNWLLKKESAQLPPTGVEVDMCRLAFDMLEDAGYVRFSTSGYYDPKRIGTYCRYLEYYWRTWPLIGFGVSSKSVIQDRLYTNVRSIREYIDRVSKGVPLLDFATRLTKDQEMRRVMIRGLKMCEVSKPEFMKRFGVPMESVFGREIAELRARGLIEDTADHISLTREGQVFSSNAWESFFTQDDVRPPAANEVQFGLSELILT
jgi:oxygen-independent coproporphyrinogen-3 oxidase